MPRLSLNGRDVNYRTNGEGPLVIALHSSSSHGGQWKALSNLISTRFSICAPDFFGYGHSDPLPEDGRPYTWHDLAIVRALLDKYEGPAHIVGHSLGGTIAVRAALSWPERIASLTLIEPVLFNLLEDAKDPRRIEYLDLSQAMMVLFHYGEAEKAARMFVDFWTGEGAFDSLDDQTRDYVVSTIPRVVEDWYGISMLAPGAVTANDLARIQVPMLVLCAENTRASARGITEIVRTAIPHAEYREIPGAGHMSPVTHPQVVNPMIEEFLMRQAG